MSDKIFVKKDWDSVTIQDNFIFGKTMEMNPELCRQLLEKILNINIKSIEYPEREKVLEMRTDSKGIRVDVYVQDNQNRSYDIEMQVADSDNIAKRMRYYQGLIDLDKLKHGQHYSSLGESYIIFICPFDKFKQGRHLYTFRERCDEDNKLSLNDGAVKIFLSTKGKIDDVSADVKAFLNYVDSGIIKGEFVQKFDAAVQAVKTNEKARLEYMTFEMALLESELEGREKNLIENLKAVMKKLNFTAEKAMDFLGRVHTSESIIIANNIKPEYKISNLSYRVKILLKRLSLRKKRSISFLSL